MKILPPTLRDGRRYLAFELIAEGPVKRDDLIREIFSAAGSLLGDVGASECAIRLLAFEDMKGVVRCSPERTSNTRAVLATIRDVRGTRVLFHVLGISGTVRAATKKYLAGVDVFNPVEQSHINE
ncbi:ribonuclease P [Methanolobus zinderi]|jgi:ribonuclease P/MRP protein subunit POP5|uniref:Ribonuclease P protein component 2 n=1 Tax=Methanolobus zinderi TaxID=536044 RepID=A0A7D5EHA5_9EURY|nr:Rpp14/Pop5 family protein [Methanolobus zinderi]KXS40490.1 MAG: ribonuclease P [Methanolobus sp. T82-4]QLC50380.1 ribonuclease P [Methanolobus zinderi]